MANFTIKMDLQKMKGVFLTTLTGKTATKRCLCIPIEENHLFVGEKGTYLDLTAIELKDGKYGDTHCIKQNFPKDVYERLSDEEKKNLPIIGNMHELRAKQQKIGAVAQAVDDDLPF